MKKDLYNGGSSFYPNIDPSTTEDIEAVLNGGTTPSEIVFSSNVVGTITFVENPLNEGEIYDLEMVVNKLNWTRIAFARTNSETAWSGENVKIILANSAVGTYNKEVVGVSKEEYPYLMYIKSKADNNIYIYSREKNVKGLIEEVEDLKKEIIAPPLKGKKILMFGDSITQMPFYGTHSGKGIVEYFAEITGADVQRCAIGGSHISARALVNSSTDIVIADSSSAMQNKARATLDCCYLIESLISQDFSKQDAALAWYDANGVVDEKWPLIISAMKDIDLSNVDIVSIFIGTNDYNSSVELSDIDSIDIKTYNGAWNYILRNLCESYPQLSIFVYTPIIRQFGDVWCEDYTNGKGEHLWDFAEASIEAAKRFGVPVCDLYHTMGWNKYNWSAFTKDGTHPQYGYQHIARKMAGFVEGNLNRFVV